MEKWFDEIQFTYNGVEGEELGLRGRRDGLEKVKREKMKMENGKCYVVKL